MEEVTALLDLVRVQLAAESEVAEASGVFLRHRCWISLGIVNVLPCTERRAHGRPDEKKRSFRLDLGPGPSSHLFIIEVPLPSIRVGDRQVERESWQYPEARA